MGSLSDFLIPELFFFSVGDLEAPGESGGLLFQPP